MGPSHSKVAVLFLFLTRPLPIVGFWQGPIIIVCVCVCVCIYIYIYIVFEQVRIRDITYIYIPPQGWELRPPHSPHAFKTCGGSIRFNLPGGQFIKYWEFSLNPLLF